MTTIIDTIALTTTVTCFAITSVFPHIIIIITTILITKSLLPLYCCIVVVVVDGLSAIGGSVFCYTHFIRSVSLISPIAKPALGRKPAGQFLLRSHTLVLGGKDISRSDSRKSLVDELSPKQLARVLRGLNACHSTCLRESYNAKHAIMELSSLACDPCRGRGLRPDCQTASPKLQYSLNPHSQSFPV